VDKYTSNFELNLFDLTEDVEIKKS